MARKLLGSLVSMFERPKLSEHDILTWAKQNMETPGCSHTIT